MPQTQWLRSSIRFLRALRTNRGPEFKPTSRQLVEMAGLFARGHLLPSEYYMYGLNLRGVTAADIARYVPGRVHWTKLLPALNDPRSVPLLHDKWLFHRHFDSRGIALPRALGVLQPQTGVGTDGRPLRSVEELRAFAREQALAGLVLKPRTGARGDGVMVLVEIGVNGTRSLNGEQIDEAMLAERLVGSAAPTDGYVVQELLEDHEALRAVNPFTSSTLRMVTLKDRSGRADVLIAVIRWGRRGGIVDNTGQGGIFARVDVASGTIGWGFHMKRRVREKIYEHPDTRVRFAGMTIPRWPQIIDLCERSAQAADGLHFIGWDVFLGPDGPVMIEGNHDFDPLSQYATEGLLRGDVRERLEGFGVSLSDERLPPLSARGLLANLRALASNS